jgi:hypothetical protein
MTELTRRRDRDRSDEHWQIFYGDVQAGTIGKRAGKRSQACLRPPCLPPWSSRSFSLGMLSSLQDQPPKASDRSCPTDQCPAVRQRR